MNSLQEIISSIPAPDQNVRAQALARLEQLIMPHWALGRLMDLALDLAAIYGTVKPSVARKLILVMCGDHGVAAAGVSRFDPEVTVQMVQSYFAGVAGCNVMARQAGAKVAVVDMGIAGDLNETVSELIIDRKVARGTQNFLEGPAMSRDQAFQALMPGSRLPACWLLRPICSVLLKWG